MKKLSAYLLLLFMVILLFSCASVPKSEYMEYMTDDYALTIIIQAEESQELNVLILSDFMAPYKGMIYKLELKNGKEITGKTDKDGWLKIKSLAPGEYKAKLYVYTAFPREDWNSNRSAISKELKDKIKLVKIPFDVIPTKIILLTKDYYAIVFQSTMFNISE